MVFPGAPRICDGKDNNCDGRLDFPNDTDNDGDGVPRCANDCNDFDAAVFPEANEGPFGDATCSDGKDNNCDGKADSGDPACAQPTCETSTIIKEGPHFVTLLNPDNTPHIDNAALLCGKCHNIDDFTDPIRDKCQRCHADAADTSDPLNGMTKSQYPMDLPFGFGSAPIVKLHSSTVVGVTYGNWELSCVTCHNPHTQEQDRTYNSTYGKYIKQYICLDNPVTGLNIEEIVEFTAPSGPGSFADGPPNNENVCEMCHTQTNHHRRTGDAPGDVDASGNYAGHFDEAQCTQCHLHSEGFKPSCGACHNAPPQAGTHLKHFSGTKDDAIYGSTEITQDVFSQASGYLMNCGNCHPLSTLNHLNGMPNSGGGHAQIELYNPNAPAGSLKAMNPANASYTPGPAVFTDSRGFNYTQGTCDNVYCHSGLVVQTNGSVPEPIPQGPAPDFWPLIYDPPWESFVVKSRQYASPTWGVDSFGCDGCHGYPILHDSTTVSAGVGDSHAWIGDRGTLNLHMWNMSFDPLQCNTCHYNTVRDSYAWIRDDFSISLEDTSIFNTAFHVNGTKDVVFTPNPVLYQKVSGDVFKDLSTATYNPGTQTCSNVACHFEQTSVKWGSPYRWWIGFECNVCHRR
jgi:predicted CxxxxCH...CXXCH cytochrome family protein